MILLAVLIADDISTDGRADWLTHIRRRTRDFASYGFRVFCGGKVLGSFPFSTRDQ
jgi:hypothetical protein